MRRVVVTGMGMVTPVGRDLESTWASLLEGKSGVGTISLFDARTFPTRIAAEVKNFRTRPTIATTPAGGPNHSRKSSSPSPRRRWPWKTPGLLECQTDSRSRPVRSLSGRRRGPARLSPVRQAGPQDHTWTARSRPAIHPAGAARPPSDRRGRTGARDTRRPPRQAFGAEGLNANCLTACAASSQAIGEAFEMIRRGRCRRGALGRHAQHDPPLRRDRVHPADSPLDPKRRAEPRQPSL